MANLYRLIARPFAVFIALQLFAVGLLHAQSCGTVWTNTRTYGTPTDGLCAGAAFTFTGTTPEAVIAQMVSKFQSCLISPSYGTYSALSCASWSSTSSAAICGYHYERGTQGSTGDGSATITNVTPCSSTNLCAELAGQFAGRYDIQTSTSGTKQICETGLNSGDPAQPGCLVTGTASIQIKIGENWFGDYRMTATGAKCAPDPSGSYDVGGPAPAPSNEAAPSTCPPGKVSGTVNGTTVCVDPGTSDPIKTSSGTTNTKTEPDGTTVQTTQNRTTDCTETSCTTTTTTTTTTTPPGGSPTTSTTSETGTCPRSSPTCTEDGDDEPSSFGGSCGAAFACDGDAVMCAVALEQHKRNCALFVDSSAESDLYNAEKGKTGTQYQNENVALGTGAFNQSNALGAGAQCIQDRNIMVMGNAITLPFSIICNTLQHFGTILIFISFLMAYRIVSRG